MLVKTFQAGEMSEALKMVKAEMGLDAMILSSKKERPKGIFGFFRKPYFEVTAAIEPRPAARPNPYREEPSPAPQRELSTREEFQNSMLGPLAREVRELKLKIEALSKKDAQQAQASQPAPPETPAEAALPRSIGKEELEEIKKLLYQAMSKEKPAEKSAETPADRQGAKPVSFPMAEGAEPATAWQPALQQIEVLTSHPVQEEQELGLRRELPEQRKGERFLELLAGELRREEVGPEAVELLLKQIAPAAHEGAGIEELRSLLLETLAGLVKCSGAVRIKKNGPRVMAMVGPTGVGKTTTIAKLAAMYALNRGVSVAMITTDNFRVGAVEQLKTYAKIMDLPLEVAGNSQELAKAVAKHSDKDLILIDTAGRSPKDAERLDELKGYLECQSGIDIYLCLSATTRSREIDEIIATFGTLPISRILFTKLDESQSFGCIVDTCLKHRLPLSYFSTGQKVPEDIEVATARKLASLVVKESAR